LYNILGARDAWRGTDDGDCQLTFALWQGAAVVFRADVPDSAAVGIQCTAM